MHLAANSKQLYAPKIIGRLFIRDKGINSQPHFAETETLYFSILPLSAISHSPACPTYYKNMSKVPDFSGSTLQCPSNIAENPIV